MEWNKLSMADRAKYIKLGVSSGITDLSVIRDSYNSYAGGGIKRTTKVVGTSGKEYGEYDNYNDAFDKAIEMDLPIYQGQLSELTVTPKKSFTLSSDRDRFEETFGISSRDAAGFVPYVGDALDVADIGRDIYEGDYRNAAIGAGMFLLPNVVEKSGKALYRGVKGVLNSVRDYNIGKGLNKLHLENNSTFKTPLSTSIEYSPNTGYPERARMPFFERHPANITEAERAGIPKGNRNNVVRESTPTNISSKDVPQGFPTERPGTGENTYKFKENLLKARQSEYTDNLRSYIAQLPQGEIIDRHTINDYRQYLNNNGINSSSLSDAEISTLIRDQYSQLVSTQTGKLKGSIMYHGSPKMFDEFDFSHTGEYTSNAGAVGPGNYFSTGRNNYGVQNNNGRMSGNMQPYLINDVQSIPNSKILLEKGLIPEYTGVGSSEYVKDLIDNWKLNRDAFIIDDHSHMMPNRVIPMREGQEVEAFEGMLHRNTGIKSLFPHPSLLQQNDEGLWQIVRDWNDNRVNYANGGLLTIRK